LTDGRPRHRGRRVVLSTSLLCLGALAACSPAKQAAPPTSGVTTTTGAAHSSTTLSSPSTTPTTSTTVPGCTGTNYALSLLGTEGAAGTSEVTFAFRNTASATCPLSGYPGIQLIDAAGADISTTTLRGGTLSITDFAPTTVEVGPGASAYFNMTYSDVTTGTETSCPTATTLQAIAPNTSTALQVPGRFTVCNNGTVTVSPVFGKDSPEIQTTAPPST
jgi:hypothetical protein